ncbi:MAG TPA: SOS response-associated peptidase [Mucilaginibacter sp.]|nr:SOS response-associated peptidase [Mucilaginibacter sp.]
MCYHVAVEGDPKDYERRFGVHLHPNFYEKWQQLHHANGFANPYLPVITQENPNEIEAAQWALVPHFAFNDADAKKYRLGTLNAKCETIFELKSFKKPVLERRCLVLASGFYESMHVGKEAFPFYIHRRDNQPFAFAGIYSYWKRDDKAIERTFSIVTTTPNKLMSKIHNSKLRMPVILPPDLERRWIRPDLMTDEIRDLMLPLEDGILTAHPVNRDLNKSKVNTNYPGITEVFEYEELAGISLEY